MLNGAKVELKQGLSWEKLPKSQLIRWVNQDEIIGKLWAMCYEWKEAAPGQDLGEVQTTVGAMITDFGRILGMPCDEIRAILKKD